MRTQGTLRTLWVLKSLQTIITIIREGAYVLQMIIAIIIISK